jgi:hypothetical protein
VWWTIEVSDVGATHERLLQLGLPIVVSLCNEAWGDGPFSIVDPSRGSHGIVLGVQSIQQERVRFRSYFCSIPFFSAITGSAFPF